MQKFSNCCYDGTYTNEQNSEALWYSPQKHHDAPLFVTTGPASHLTLQSMQIQLCSAVMWLWLTLWTEIQSTRGYIAQTQRGSLLAANQVGTGEEAAVRRKPTLKSWLHLLCFLISHLKTPVHNTLQGLSESNQRKTEINYDSHNTGSYSWPSTPGCALKQNCKWDTLQPASQTPSSQKGTVFWHNLSQAYQGLQPVAIGVECK